MDTSRQTDSAKSDHHHDFVNESTYFCLLKDGKAFVECVIAFHFMSSAFNSHTRSPVRGAGV